MTTGTAINHTPNTGIFTLKENGFYQIHYNTVGTNSASAKLPTSLGVHLTNGGVAIPGTMSTSTIDKDKDTEALAGTTIVNVTSAPVTISLVAENKNGSYNHTAISITKIG